MEGANQKKKGKSVGVGLDSRIVVVVAAATAAISESLLIDTSVFFSINVNRAEIQAHLRRTVPISPDATICIMPIDCALFPIHSAVRGEMCFCLFVLGHLSNALDTHTCGLAYVSIPPETSSTVNVPNVYSHSASENVFIVSSATQLSHYAYVLSLFGCIPLLRREREGERVGHVISGPHRVLVTGVPRRAAAVDTLLQRTTITRTERDKS